jgi:hypothetical protein
VPDLAKADVMVVIPTGAKHGGMRSNGLGEVVPPIKMIIYFVATGASGILQTRIGFEDPQFRRVSARTRGCGYDMVSAVASDLFYKSGFELDRSIDAAGETAAMKALIALGHAMELPNPRLIRVST